MSRLSRRRLNLCNLGVAIALAATLAFACWLWSFSYFWTDDFGNIYWTRTESAGRMLGHLVNPLSTFFRPLGMLFYWAMYHTFGLNPLPYHLLAWSLHGVNIVLIFLVLRKILKSSFAAAAGAVPFAFRVNFADMYWSFGTIFELLACGLMLVGMLVYLRSRRLSSILILTGIYFLAVKSKEMAITLVPVWLLLDCCLSKDFWNSWRRILLRLAAPLAVMAWFVYLRVGTMRNLNPELPYYLDFRLGTMLGGFTQYFNWLYPVKLPAAGWCVLGLVLLAVFLYKRERAGVFFLSYTFVAFIPVIFLVNHRWPYMWYIPFFGIAGLFGIAAKHIQWRVRRLLSLPQLVVLNAVLLISWAGINGGGEFLRSRATREVQASLSGEFKSFVEGMRQIETPEANSILYFDAMPRNFDRQILDFAVQVVLGRADVHGELVSSFPADARWKLRFADGRLQRVTAQ